MMMAITICRSHHGDASVLLSWDVNFSSNQGASLALGIESFNREKYLYGIKGASQIKTSNKEKKRKH